MANRGNEVDPADIYGESYNKQDNRGKQLGINKSAVKAPKPYGEEGRGVKVEEAAVYEDDLAAKMERMLSRNRHTKEQNAGAKEKGQCGGCGRAVTEDDKWVEGLGKRFHTKCFVCAECGKGVEGQKYFERAGRPVCGACEERQQETCPQCGKACRPEQASVKALSQQWHVSCFQCHKCHKKLGQEGNRTFREKDGHPFCDGCVQ